MLKEIIEDVFRNDYKNFKSYLVSRFDHINEYDAEDIIQQTVVKLLYKGNDALSIQNMTSYIYKSIRNGAYDLLKKRNREILGDELPDGETLTAEDELLIKELKNVLKEAIDKLDEKSRFIFIETELKGKSYKTVSVETGIKLGTLLSRKSRAMKKLEQILKDYVKGAI
ncbi:MAG: sigma-70 family RNA polymerase sigma factor [Clostridia bacterium]|nr:sigma-70 family RNA polymerase sigma factor [Clostridia bacterium]